MIVVEDARTMSANSGVSQCRQTGPLRAVMTGASMSRKFIRRRRTFQWAASHERAEARGSEAGDPFGPLNSSPAPVRITTRLWGSSAIARNASCISVAGAAPQRRLPPSVWNVTCRIPRCVRNGRSRNGLHSQQARLPRRTPYRRTRIARLRGSGRITARAGGRLPGRVALLAFGDARGGRLPAGADQGRQPSTRERSACVRSSSSRPAARRSASGTARWPTAHPADVLGPVQMEVLRRAGVDPARSARSSAAASTRSAPRP